MKLGALGSIMICLDITLNFIYFQGKNDFAKIYENNAW